MNGRSYSLLVVALLGVTCAAFTPTGGYINRRQVTEPCPAVLPLSKLMLNQSNYVQYVHYFTPIPDLQSFTIQYWFNLITTDRISTTFDYTVRGPTNSTIRINLQRGQPQRWFLYINEVLVSNVISPLVRAGEWHFMVHSWNSWTGSWSVYMDGALLGANSSPEGRGLVVRGGGEAYSGQRQNTDDGMDRGEGLEGWMTLFQMSVRPLLNPASAQTLRMVSLLGSSCNGQFNGDLISWSRTPRKGYGGPQETPARPVCVTHSAGIHSPIMYRFPEQRSKDIMFVCKQRKPQQGKDHLIGSQSRCLWEEHVKDFRLDTFAAIFSLFSTTLLLSLPQPPRQSG